MSLEYTRGSEADMVRMARVAHLSFRSNKIWAKREGPSIVGPDVTEKRTTGTKTAQVCTDVPQATATMMREQ